MPIAYSSAHSTLATLDSDIQGDDAVEETHPVDEDSTLANQPAQNYRPAIEPNGKLPEDIPSSQGDDIIAQKFRQAAIEEPDAKTKARLWNEYRRYNGLPEQKPENG